MTYTVPKKPDKPLYLERSRELLGYAYQLYLRKQELLAELERLSDEMEALIHSAYEELPGIYDPEQWLIIETDVIAKWLNPGDTTHVVEFRKVY